MRALTAATMSTLWTACVFHGEVDTAPLPQITCTDDDDCPPNLRCARDAQRCAPPGDDVDVTPPAVVSLAFTPPIARADTVVRLELVATEDLARAPSLSFADDAPALTLNEDGPQRFVWTLAPRDAPPDERHTLTRVALEDAAGNRAEIVVAEELVIDRAPVVVTALVTDALVYAPNPGHDVVTASVRTEEALDTAPASFTMLLDDAPFACAPFDPATRGYACTLPITDEAHGDHIVQAVAVDRAGNFSIIGTSVTVDREAASVVSAELAVSTSGAAAGAAALTLGGSASVAIVASEALSAATVRASGPADIAFVTSDVSDAAATAEFFMNAPLPLGAYALEATLTDAVGNDSEPLPLLVAAPGLVVADGVDSPCVMTDVAGAPVCTDYDDDGFDGRSAGCPNGDDCHDDDPFVHPGAPDLAGDFGDNGCTGGAGTVASDAVGVFMAPDGDDDSAGTQDAPVRSLARALALVLDGKNTVFVASGDYGTQAAPDDYVTLIENDVVVIGGFDAQWRLTPQRSALRLDAPQPGRSTIESVTALQIAHVDLVLADTSNVIEMPSVTLRDASLTVECGGDCYTHTAALYAWRAQLRGMSVSGDVTLVDSQIDASSLSGGRHTFVRSVAFVDQVYSGEKLVAIGSVVAGTLEMEGEVEAWGSTLLASRLINSSQTGGVLIVGSIVDFDEMGIDAAPPGGVTLLYNDVHVPCWINDSEGECQASTAAEIDACAWEGCVSAVGNVTLAPELEGDSVHLSAASGLPPGPSYPLVGAPDALAGDVDGACRDVRAPDLGADER
jgi:hypothetical protein